MKRIQSLTRLQIADGCLADVLRLAARCLERARSLPPGTLRHDLILNGDETEVVVYEEFTDAAAALRHFQALEELTLLMKDIATLDREVWGASEPALDVWLAAHRIARLNPLMRLRD